MTEKYESGDTSETESNSFEELTPKLLKGSKIVDGPLREARKNAQIPRRNRVIEWNCDS